MKKSTHLSVWTLLLGLLPLIGGGGYYLVLKPDRSMEIVPVAAYETNLPVASATQPDSTSGVNETSSSLSDAPPPRPVSTIATEEVINQPIVNPAPALPKLNAINHADPSGVAAAAIAELEIRRFEAQMEKERWSRWMALLGTVNTVAMGWATFFFRGREKRNEK